MRLGTLVGLLSIVIALYILWRIKQVLLLAFTAIVFATAINQLVKLLQAKLALQRNTVIAVSVTGVLAFIAGFIVLVVPPFVDQFQDLVTLVPLGLEQLSSWNEWLQNFLPDALVDEIRQLETLGQNSRSWEHPTYALSGAES